MSGPNVFCKLRYVDNNDSLSKNEIRRDKYSGKRRFYSSNQENDYLKYVDTGINEAKDYLDYTGNEEKSYGAFNVDGLLSAKKRANLRTMLRTTDSVIWDMVLSFEEAFGKRYVSSYEEAHTLMKKLFPAFLKSAGFDPNNIAWYAGLHENTSNHHVHISFFELSPTRYRANKQGLHYSNGRISRRALDEIRIRAEQLLTDTSAEIKASRKEVNEMHKEVLFGNNDLRYNSEYRKKLEELLSSMPLTGRISYDSQPMLPLRQNIKYLVDIIIKSDRKLYKAFNKYCAAIKKKDDDTKIMLTANKIRTERWQYYLKSSKYLDDLYRRLGNQVINSIRVFKGSEPKARSRLAQKRIRKNSKTKLLAYSLTLAADIERDAYEIFAEHIRKLEKHEKERKKELEHEME